MKFHLEYQPPISDYKITHQSEIILIGSCFSDHIGKRLRELKFNVDFNPLGIVFNPKSIAILKKVDYGIRWKLIAQFMKQLKSY